MNKEESEKNTRRPPIAVVMGHIDHGKSKLLDFIRKSNVVEKEAGGITQHIGAYEAEVECKSSEHKHATQKITFLDTPGHEAFSKMRTRGAKIADVAILVIAADEGVKPQTIEAYNSIKESGIPFVIAFNKMDNAGANPEMVKGQLAENQIFVEGYGGDVPSTNISAKTGQGVSELLDLVLLLTDMEDLKANPEDNASGIVIESHLDPKRGISSTILVQNGTVKRGMFVVAGDAISPVRIFENFKGDVLDEATFSMPIKITGFDKVPEAGTGFKTFKTKLEAEDYASKNIGKVSEIIENLVIEEQANKDKVFVPLIIKADTKGSVEALEKEILKLSSDEAIINIVRKDVGDIKENDIKLVSGTRNPVILGFNINMDPSIREMSERFNVIIFNSNIIYKISEWLEEEIGKRKSQIPREETLGISKILKIFSKTKNKQVLGGEVLSGKIIKGKHVKIKRRDNEIADGKIVELQHKKEKVSEVIEGLQFGAVIETKVELITGDTLEIIEKIQ